MNTLEGQNVIVTGGSRGIGRGIVEAMIERKARVTVVARTEGPLAEVQQRFGAATRKGDITDAALAESLLREVRPSVLVLNAGAKPGQGPIDEQTWEQFQRNWEVDVKGAFVWIQAALRLPLAPGSRVIVSSSGAAVGGSPMSGGYAGAKRTQWFMAQYANGVATDRGLGIHFQVLVPRQMLDTDLGRTGAASYAKKRGITPEAVLAGFGKAMSPRDVGNHVVSILTDPQYERGVAFGVKGDTGIHSLDQS